MKDALGAAFGTSCADADPVIRPSQFADFQANVAVAGQAGGPPPPGHRAELTRHLDLTGVAEQPG